MRVFIEDVELTPKNNCDPVEFAKACCLSYASYCLNNTRSPEIYIGNTEKELTQINYFSNKNGVIDSLIPKCRAKQKYDYEDEEMFY